MLNYLPIPSGRTLLSNRMQNLLESGNYKVDENFVPLEKNAERAQMSKLVARSLGLKDAEVDVTQGMGNLRVDSS